MLHHCKKEKMMKRISVIFGLILISGSALAVSPNLKRFAVRGLNASEKTVFQASYDQLNMAATLSGSFQRYVSEENKTYTYDFKVMQNFGGDPKGQENPFPGGYILEVRNPFKNESQSYVLGSDSSPNELTFYRPVLDHDPDLFKDYKTIDVIRFGFSNPHTVYAAIGQGTIYCTADSPSGKEFKFCGWGSYEPLPFALQSN